MEFKSFDDLMKSLAGRKFAPIYLLEGEEPFFIDKAAEYLENSVLEEHQKPFNLNIVYGKDLDGPQVDNLARRFPMGADHNLIIVKEAQNLSDVDKLVHYAGNPLASTILVLCHKHKNFDRRTKVFKAIEKNGVVFGSKRVYDDKIPRWIINYLSSKNCRIEPNAAMILNEYLGNDLSRIASELDKLLITLPTGSTKITPEHIEENIGISKEYNNFELMKALARRNVAKCYRIVHYFGENPKDNSVSQTVSSLFYFFSKVLALHFIDSRENRDIASTLQLHAFFVSDYQQAAKNFSRKKSVEIISILREYDLKSKGFGSVNTPDGELLKEMIYRILH